MERISYDEAREWFWVRTAVWFVPAYIVSAMGLFVYAGTMIEDFKIRTAVSLLCALGVTLLGLIAAMLSIQFPWMRLGRRRLWPLTTLACALIACFGAVAVSAVILTVLRGKMEHVAGDYVWNTAHSLMAVGIAVAGFWGAAFGTWFALRFDKYFVESI